MANLGSLVVSLEANMARFNDDMNRASQVTQQAMAQVEAATSAAATSIKTIGFAMAGIAAGVSFQALINQFDAVVASATGLKDMAEKTGASIENMSGLAAVAKLVGQDMTAVEGAMTKFAKNLAGTSDESKGTAHALDTLGLKMRDLRQMDSADALKLVADKMAEYRDGVGKTALAQDLFGKSGAQLIPYLKDLAESGDLVAKTTAEQAEQADQYEKNIKRLTIAKNALYKTITMEVLPSINAFLTVMIDAKSKTDGMQQAAKDLAADGSIRSWAEQAAMHAARVIDVFDGVARTFKVLGMSLAGIWKDIETAATVGMTAVGAGFTAEGQAKITSAISERNAFMAAMNKDIDATLSKPLFSQRLAQQFEANRNATPDAAPTRTLNNYQSNLGTTKAVKEQKDDYDRLMRSITEKIAVQQAELSGQEKLTDAAKEYAKFQADVQNGYVKLTKDELGKVNAQWEVFLRNADALQAKARDLAYNTARLSIGDIAGSFGRDNQTRSDNMAIMPQALREQEAALRAVDEKAREADKTLRRLFADGKIDAEQYGKLLAELNTTISDQKEAVRGLLDQQQRLNASWEYGAAGAVQKYIDSVRNMAAQTDAVVTRSFATMEDALTQLVTKGKLDFKGLADSIIADLLRIAVRQQITGPLAQAVQGAGGFGGILSSLGGLIGMGGGAIAGPKTGSIVPNSDVAQAIPIKLDGLPSFDVGTDYVPHDMIAKIHAGERIVPAAQNKAGFGGLTQHLTINVGGGGVDSRTVQQIALQAGMQAQRALSRNG